MLNNVNPAMRGAVSGVVGGAVFVLFAVAMGVSLPLSLGASVGGFVGTFLVLKRKKDLGLDIIVGGITKKDYNEAMAELEGKLKNLQANVASIKNQTVKGKAGQVVDVVRRIQENFRKDPKDIKSGRQFISYYLDATVKIVQRYVDLSAHDRGSAEVREALGKTEMLLETIRGAFEKQLALLLRDDIMDLETEIKVLEKTIKLEGLGE